MRTVFVLGAGASAEVNLPIGNGLTSRIANLLTLMREPGRVFIGDDLIRSAADQAAYAAQHGTPKNAFWIACQEIVSGMPMATSIDSFLDEHRDNPVLTWCGKLAIARAILQAEEKSTLYLDPRVSNAKLAHGELATDTWYPQLRQILMSGCRAQELKARFESASFIVFNYDRCLEQYLFHAIKGYYLTDAAVATDALKTLKIIHPYGQVGRLPWQGGTATIEFGAEPTVQVLEELAQGLRTFTETVDENAEITEMRRLLEEAERIVFLGFAYLPQNLKLLWPPSSDRKRLSGKWCFGTSFGRKKFNTERTKEWFVNTLGIFPNQIWLDESSTCKELFQVYQSGLSFQE